MDEIRRKNRRRLTWGCFLLLVIIVGWLMLPNDIGQYESSLASVIATMLCGVITAFIGGETYSDHSERRHGNKDD